MPGKRGRGRLHRHECYSGKQVTERYARERVPDVLEPVGDVPAGKRCGGADHDDD